MSSDKFPPSMQKEMLDKQILAEAAERDLDPNRQAMSVFLTGEARTEAFDEKVIQVLGIGPFLERYGFQLLVLAFFGALATGHLKGFLGVLAKAFIQTR